MGMALPYPQFELLENFGEEEVFDSSPPQSPTGAMFRGSLGKIEMSQGEPKEGTDDLLHALV